MAAALVSVIGRGFVEAGRYLYRFLGRRVEERSERPADLHEIDYDDLPDAKLDNPEYPRKRIRFWQSQNPELRLGGYYKFVRKKDPERRKGAWLIRNILHRKDRIFSEDNYLGHYNRGNALPAGFNRKILQKRIQYDSKRFDKDLPYYESLLKEGGMFYDKNSFAEYFFNHAFEFYYEDKFNDIENLYRMLKKLHPEIEYHLDTTFGDQWMNNFKTYLKEINFAKPVPQYGRLKARRVRLPPNYFVKMKSHFIYKMGGVEYANHPMWLQKILPLLEDEGEDAYTKFYIATNSDSDLSFQFEELFYSKKGISAKNPHNIYFPDEET